MKKILLLLTLIIPIIGIAQDDDIPAPELAEEPIFEAVEWKPIFIGGKDSLDRFIASNIIYPKSAVKENKEGRVYVKFTIEKDGSVSNIEPVKSFDAACSKEAMRVIKLTSGNWNPGRQRGKKVRVNMVLPIIFKLN